MKKIIVRYIQNNDLIALNRQSNIISSISTEIRTKGRDDLGDRFGGRSLMGVRVSGG